MIPSDRYIKCESEYFSIVNYFTFYSEDCYQLLGRCLDWSRISATITLSMLCERFSSEKSNTPCVSIQNFLEPHESDDSWISAAPSRHVSSPCRNNPCNNNGGHQVCMVNRNCQSGRGRTCHPYICTSGKVTIDFIAFFVCYRIS